MPSQTASRQIPAASAMAVCGPSMVRLLAVPLGLFFALVGLLLAYNWREAAPLTTSPVNLYAGVTMVLFGGVMVWLAKRRS